MERSDLKIFLDQFKTSMKRLREVLTKDIKKDDAYLDASIQRFEFTFELCWKTLKRFLAFQGIEARTPRDAFKEAFKLGWLIGTEEFWLGMLDDRNETSHTYDLKTALSIHGRLDQYLAVYEKLVSKLEFEA